MIDNAQYIPSDELQELGIKVQKLHKKLNKVLMKVGKAGGCCGNCVYYYRKTETCAIRLGVNAQVISTLPNDFCSDWFPY